MLVVRRYCGPDVKAYLPPLQQRERPAEDTLENIATHKSLERGQIPAREDL
jgi:hypothetical protein